MKMTVKNNCRSSVYDIDIFRLYLPESDEIRIIDMGGATFDHDHHSSVINTR